MRRMDHPDPVVAYVALGSNLGDRLSHLQAAVSALAATRGIEVTSVSPIYENPVQATGGLPGGSQPRSAARGAKSSASSPRNVASHAGRSSERSRTSGEGPDFLNAVVAVTTVLRPRELLDRLLSIETARGRVRDENDKAAPRTLDLDLLLYGKDVIHEPGLEIPHPRMAGRRFVLRPLADIAPFLTIPGPPSADLVDLLARCPDHTHLTKQEATLRIPTRGGMRQAELWPEQKPTPIARPATRLPSDLRYIVIEGVIGVGKTTLAREIARRFGASIVLEQFEENPFLSHFYDDRGRWAFQTQLSFLASRFRQQQNLARRDLFHDITVSDYAFDKDRIFARINLNGDELQLYETLFTIMQPSVPQPDLVVYLQSTTDRLLEQIRQRGRDYEQNMDPAYIQTLNDAYNAYFFHYTQSPLLIVNTSRLDFVKNPDDLEELFRQVARIHPAGTTYFNPVRPV